MSLLTLDKVSLAYGHQPLLDKVDLQIEPGERVCLIGRNGAGKSSLLKVICGKQQADEGDIWLRPGHKMAYLEQDVPADETLTVYEVISAGLGEVGQLVSRYHEVAHRLASEQTDSLMNEMSALQQQLEAKDGWSQSQKIDTVVSKLQLDADRLMSELSGGMKRRVILAQALVNEPDLLLLDEPTNHLDIASITWLESFLMDYQGTLIFITHDRTFLKHLATRIIELDRGVLRSFPGNYQEYLHRKDQQLQAEETANKQFDKKLAQEEEWIRKGIKARRTRNEGRVRALQALRKERSQRREQQGQVNLSVQTAETAGKLVADLRNVSFEYDGRYIIKDFSARILRGDRIGIIGQNGSGKSTLLQLILGQLQPQQGEVILGTKLQIAYYDQQRDQLDYQKSVKDNINDGQEFVSIQGRSKHIISYLKDFLFPAEKVNTPVKALSGGERNRLMLAKTFLQPANLLVLDEPTNDLDVETLELLEELLMNFDGTLLLVSHDRSFLDNVVTSTFVFEGQGRVQEYVGGYEDWLRQSKSTVNEAANSKGLPVQTEKNSSNKPGLRKKLSYKDQKELDELPVKIEKLEAEKQRYEQQTLGNDFYRQDQQQIKQTLDKLAELEQELQIAYEKWEQLDQLVES